MGEVINICSTGNEMYVVLESDDIIFGKRNIRTLADKIKKSGFIAKYVTISSGNYMLL